MGPLDHDTDRLQLLDTRLTFPIIVMPPPLPVARAAQEAERLRLGGAQVVGANDEPESGSEAPSALRKRPVGLPPWDRGVPVARLCNTTLS